MQRYTYDVLVIGGGGAGCVAAYEASKYIARVGLVSKGYITRSGATIMAPGAIAGVDSRWKHENDSKDLHLLDTVKGGAFLNEQRLVKILVDESPDGIVEMEHIGTLWERTVRGDNYSLRTGGGHKYPRCVYMEDHTGHELMRGLYGELLKRHIPVHEGIIITRLIRGGDGVRGAVGIDITNLEPVIFESNAIILATGGAGMVYINTSTSVDVTGDGYKLALDAGASLMDMEMVQFFPIGFLFPPSYRGILAALPYHSHLKNAKGERFMKRYDPKRMELSTRDIVSRAMFLEVKEGRGGPLGGVYCDMTFQSPEFLAEKQPFLYNTYLRLGIDTTKDMIEVMPTCHFFMGGVVVNENWESTVPGLFAVGETAAGIHGANRLSQNALAHVIVSGRRAGKSAAELVMKKRETLYHINPKEAVKEEKKVKKILKYHPKKHITPLELRKKLRLSMWEKAGLFRTGKGLKEQIDFISNLKNFRVSVETKNEFLNQDLIISLENESLLETAYCIAIAALERTESRGAHYRSDYPTQDDTNWLRHIIIRKTNGRLELQYQPVDISIIRTRGEV